MTKLIIDTSTQYVVVGLGSKQVCQKSNMKHLEILPSIVKSLLNDCSKKISDIDEVVVGIGPGLYAGLRVGISFCRAIVQTIKVSKNEVDFYGLYSHIFLASAFFNEFEEKGINDIEVIEDARQNEVCKSKIKFENGNWLHAGIFELAPNEGIVLQESIPNVEYYLNKEVPYQSKIYNIEPYYIRESV